MNMNSIGKALFEAIHKGKWLSIVYKNQSEQITKYWIAVKTLSPQNGQMQVDGLHLGRLTVQELYIRVERIISAEVIEGSWCEINEALVQDVMENPRKYEALFGNTANLRVLEYLTDCHKLDSTPYKTEYFLISQLDQDRFQDGTLALNGVQFAEIVRNFQNRIESQSNRKKRQIRQLGMNLLSVHTDCGLYVLAYQPLGLDIENHTLRPVDKVVVCREFTVDGVKVSAHAFLDAEDYALLDEFEENAEEIKDRMTQTCSWIQGVDDMPYLVAIGREVLVDLEHEYRGISRMFDAPEGEGVTPPIQAFFRQMVARPRRRKSFPLALLNNKVNLDQMLAINNAMRYPIAYVQGPPGTGKTNTIVNTMTTAFFNERTVLFASYNNHPIDGVVKKLKSLEYKGQKIPFPIVRLGNNDCVERALKEIRQMYEACQRITVYEKTLDRNHEQRVERAKRLTELLERYDEILDLQERRETIQRLLEARNHMNFQFELQTGQLPKVEAELKRRGTVTTEDALALLDQNEQEFLKYLYYTSAKYIRRLGEPKNEELKSIIYSEADPAANVLAFHRYLSKAAVSLVPIVRGNSLMLVGDPQQLRPVILLDPKDNEVLRKRYHVGEEYDYIRNSVYTCFLACDSVSDEVLLRYHYRCDPKIIAFNNKKYYNQKLQVASKGKSKRPLVYVNLPHDTSTEKNTAPAEVDLIDRYLSKYPEKSVGIITPFARQRELIQQMLTEKHYSNGTCGTVHSFQGDEKDVVIFSLALTDKTRPQTYQWLKNNKELINVATSRAKDQLILLSNNQELERLHGTETDDDLYDLVKYVRSNGVSEVSPKPAASRALGIKPYSTETEEAFLQTLNHALDNVFLSEKRYTVRREVAISHVFQNNPSYCDLFYTGRFDFVVYQREGRQQLIPILAIELDGQEHKDDPIVQQRDRKKEKICRDHGFELIRVENTYARRYHYIKEILIEYFRSRA